MRIAHVINRYSSSGGAENQLWMNLSHFADSRLSHQVIALYRDRDTLDRSDHPFPVEHLFDETERPGRVQAYRVLAGRLRDIGPSLIHCSLADSALASRIAGPRLGVPVLESLVNVSHEPVRTIDNPGVRRWKLAAHRSLDRMTMRRVTHFHALTRTVADSWTRQVGLDRNRISIIPRGVDLARFDVTSKERTKSEVRGELGLDGSTPVIVSVAREEPQKGLRYLIEAMPSILNRFPDTRLVMAGRAGNSSNALSALIASLGLTSHVLRIGVRPDISRLLLAADVFAFPSLYEGQGVALLEAMATGCACVVADIPAVREVVVPDESALIVPMRDPRALGDAISRILSGSELPTRLGAAARRTVEERFRIEDTVSRMESLYRRLGGLE